MGLFAAASVVAGGGGAGGGGSGGNVCKKGHAFVAMVAVVSFMSGILTSPLTSFLQCSLPSFQPTAFHPASADHGTLVPAHEHRVTDWSSTDLARFRTNCSEPFPPSAVRRLILNKVHDGVSPFQGFPPEYAKPWLREKRIRGWGSYGSVFERLIEEVKPNIILELGTYLGASALHMAALSESIIGRPSLIICIDDFRGWPGFRDKFRFPQVHADVQLLYQFLQNVVTMNMTESILPMPFSTTSAMSALCDWGVYFDLIEVDAAHDFHSAWADINLGYALLRSGGVMFGHDYFTKLDNRGVGRAVDLFAKVKGLRVETDGQHWILRSP